MRCTTVPHCHSCRLQICFRTCRVLLKFCLLRLRKGLIPLGCEEDEGAATQILLEEAIIMIKTLVLGAGHEVGKSCVVVMISGKTIMFDCGMHLAYHDARRFPDFSLIPKQGNFSQTIDCVIVTHFHLDHIGALPYFTEVCGYEGPIYMTYPTKALAPLMLEDYRKVMVERRGEQEEFSAKQIHDCIKKVTAVDLKQTILLGSDIQLRAYYAGHVLGAAMFYVKVGESTVVYTGDYNMTPDRHLGAAQIDRLQPDLIITESTYATTIKDSKHAREREFLKAVHKCVAGGGKVLIPVFALGRAQELCILLDDYWERMNLTAPIYFSAGLTMQANVYYKLLISWTNQKVKDTCVTRNTFDFKHVSAFDRSRLHESGPCVLFATPGMLNGGLSLEVFKMWAPSEHNMLVVPGYCVPGTIGYKLIMRKSAKIKIDKKTHLDVRCQVHLLSFSAHTDAKGIMDLLRHVGPKHVILVHGEAPKMALLKARITTELGFPCFDPRNGEIIEVPSHLTVKVLASERFLANAKKGTTKLKDQSTSSELKGAVSDVTVKDIHTGIMLMDEERTIQVLQVEEALDLLNVHQHKLLYRCYCPLRIIKSNHKDPAEAMCSLQEGKVSGELERPTKKHCSIMQNTSDSLQQDEPKLTIAEEVSVESTVAKCLGDSCDTHQGSLSLEPSSVLQDVYTQLIQKLGSGALRKQDDRITANSLSIQVSSESYRKSEGQKTASLALVCTWSAQDEGLANVVLSLINRTRLSPRTTNNVL